MCPPSDFSSQVQDIVVGNKTFTDVTKPSEIVQLLLNENQLANLDSSSAATAKKNGKKPAGQAVQDDATVRELWNEEGDDFFGHTAASQAAATATIGDVVEEEGTPVPTTGRGKKRRGNGDGARRKPGPKPGRKKAQPAAAEADT